MIYPHLLAEKLVDLVVRGLTSVDLSRTDRDSFKDVLEVTTRSVTLAR